MISTHVPQTRRVSRLRVLFLLSKRALSVEYVQTRLTVFVKAFCLWPQLCLQVSLLGTCMWVFFNTHMTCRIFLSSVVHLWFVIVTNLNAWHRSFLPNFWRQSNIFTCVNITWLYCVIFLDIFLSHKFRKYLLWQMNSMRDNLKVLWLM